MFANFKGNGLHHLELYCTVIIEECLKQAFLSCKCMHLKLVYILLHFRNEIIEIFEILQFLLSIFYLGFVI